MNSNNSSLSKRSRVVRTILCITTVAAVGLIFLGKVSRRSSPPLQKQLQHKKNPFVVLAYGDSLTAGVSGSELFPYAPHLQAALSDNVVVEHVGLPGWTAVQMVNGMEDERVGVLWNVQQRQKVSLVIVLAGTNDLGRSQSLNATAIANTIIRLHTLCYKQGVPHTIMVGIPGSAYQTRNTMAASTAAAINNQLQLFASNHGPTTTYVDFPFPFERSSDLWHADGLHLSRLGYETLGKRLAPVVQQIVEHKVVPQAAM